MLANTHFWVLNRQGIVFMLSMNHKSNQNNLKKNPITGLKKEMVEAGGKEVMRLNN